MTDVRISNRARHFLERESQYLFDRSPSAAMDFLRRIDDACRNLTQFPNLGRRQDGFPLRNSFRLVVDDYVLNYDMDDIGIVVTAIRHGKQLPVDLPDHDDDV